MFTYTFVYTFGFAPQTPSCCTPHTKHNPNNSICCYLGLLGL
jgi:hypothetical protein